MDYTEPKEISQTCPACNGEKIQRRTSDGIKIICPACGGTGIYPPPVRY